MTMEIADGPMPYRLDERICPHCGNEYRGGKNSGMCPDCRASEPGAARKKRWSAQFNARKKKRRAK